MKYQAPLIEAKFMKREKRFFAYARLPSGEEIVGHCPNPGSMKGNLQPDSRAWFLDFGKDHLESGKKLRYKWVMVESDGHRICIDTLCANQIVGEALREGKIPELAAYKEIVPEKKIGDSRVDFFLPGTSSLPDCYVEVKSVSMGEGANGAFPDSVTERGQKHIRELEGLVAKGKRAVLFFLHMREGGKTVRAAREIDPVYAELLEGALKKGVEVLVYGIDVKGAEIFVGERGQFI